MKMVLHVITGLGSGGAERMLTRIVTTPDTAIRPVVVSLMDDGVHGETLRAAGVELHCLGMRGPLSFPGALLRLAALLRRQRPAVVMTWLYHADLLGTLAVVLANKPPLVWNLRCSNMDLSRYARSTGWVVAALARLSRLPRLVAVNSEAGRKAHQALGYAPRQWLVLPNGFDLGEWRPDAADRAAVRAELGLAAGDVAFVLVARVDPQKDHDTFVAAATAVTHLRPQGRFVLIGRGTDRLPLPAEMAPRTILLGERRDVARLLRGMDVGVLSSAFGEGFPNALGEAMATALPCIVTDVGDAAAILGPGGAVVPPRDVRALAAAMTAMLDAPRLRLGAEARRRIEENWSMPAVQQQYQAVWQRFTV